MTDAELRAARAAYDRLSRPRDPFRAAKAKARV